MCETFGKGFAVSSGLRLKPRIVCECVGVRVCVRAHSCECPPVRVGFFPPVCCFYAKASHMVAFRSSFTAEVFQTLMNGSLVI